MTQPFDILVAGAGPAGIAAAVTAAECGLRVALVDDNPTPGGQIWRAGAHIPRAAQHWIARLNASSVHQLRGWRIFDSPRPGVLLAESVAQTPRPEPAELRYNRLILATGARERFLPFPGWTLPNIMGVGALDAISRSGLPVAGKRIVVAGTSPLLLAAAAHLAQRGAHILAICEQAPLQQLLPLAAHTLSHPGKLRQALQYSWLIKDARYLTSCWPVAAHGDTQLRSVTLRQRDEQWSIDCDYLACAFHLVPNIELAALLGCRLDNGFVATDDRLQTSIPNVWCAGEPTSIGGVELSLLEGQLAALAAAGHSDAAHRLVPRRHASQRFVRALRQACALNPALRQLPSADTIVCRCEDVRLESLRSRSSWRDGKLHTRCGMGPCQGRVCGPATEFLFGWRAESVRPPLFPTPVSHLASASISTRNTSTEAP